MFNLLSFHVFFVIREDRGLPKVYWMSYLVCLIHAVNPTTHVLGYLQVKLFYFTTDNITVQASPPDNYLLVTQFQP